jgi:hypothetical protein
VQWHPAATVQLIRLSSHRAESTVSCLSCLYTHSPLFSLGSDCWYTARGECRGVREYVLTQNRRRGHCVSRSVGNAYSRHTICNGRVQLRSCTPAEDVARRSGVSLYRGVVGVSLLAVATLRAICALSGGRCSGSSRPTHPAHASPHSPYHTGMAVSPFATMMAYRCWIQRPCSRNCGSRALKSPSVHHPCRAASSHSSSTF